MRRKWLLLLMCLIGVAILTVNCGNDQESSSADNGKTMLSGTYQNQNPVIVMDDGQKLVGNDQIIAEFRKRAESNPEAIYQINISGNEVPQAGNLPDGGVAPSGVKIPLPYSYNAVFAAPHYGYVAGYCIKRNIVHVNFIINKTGVTTPIADLHIGSWIENGKICVGVYVSPQGWCKKICSPTFNDIVGAIAGALISMGIYYSVAWAMAYVLAPIACALLAI